MAELLCEGLAASAAAEVELDPLSEDLEPLKKFSTQVEGMPGEGCRVENGREVARVWMDIAKRGQDLVEG